MKKFISILLEAILIVPFLTSCAKLDLTPVDSITQDKYWNTPDEAAAAVVGLNDNLQTVALWSGVWGDLRADIYSSTRGNLVQTLTDVMKNNLTSESPFGNWTRLYTAIGTANWILKNLSKVQGLTDVTRNQYMGEALFARSFCYYYAVRIWGDVPLITEPYTSATDDFFQPRNSKAEVYAQIEKDIEEAILKLPVSFGSISNTKGRPTKWAALALKTDYSLWMAKVEGRAGYAQKSLEAANELLSKSGLSLVSTANYATIFSSKNTTESIYEIQFNNSINEVQDNGTGSSFSPAALTSYDPFGSFNRLLIHEKLISTFEPGDARVNAVTLDIKLFFSQVH